MTTDNIPAPDRCELCGALRFGAGETDLRPSYDAVEMLRRLADIWLQDRVALGIVLARVAMPTASMRELGSVVGRDVSTVAHHMRALRKHSGALGAFVQSKNAHAQAWKRRRVSHA